MHSSARFPALCSSVVRGLNHVAVADDGELVFRSYPAALYFLGIGINIRFFPVLVSCPVSCPLSGISPWPGLLSGSPGSPAAECCLVALLPGGGRTCVVAVPCDLRASAHARG